MGLVDRRHFTINSSHTFRMSPVCNGCASVIATFERYNVYNLFTAFSKTPCPQPLPKRHLLTEFIKIDGVLDEQVALCLESIEWTKSEKRQFLRQTLEIMLASLHLKARYVPPSHRQFLSSRGIVLGFATPPHTHTHTRARARASCTGRPRCRHLGSSQFGW